MFTCEIWLFDWYFLNFANLTPVYAMLLSNL